MITSSVQLRRVDMAEVNLKFLQDLIKVDHPDVTVNYFEGAPGSKRGDNYTSMVYRITLKGVRRHIEPDGSSERDEPWDGSIIYKCLPESIHLRDAFKSDELFCNEVAFYNKIWPALRSFQKVWDTVKTPFKAIPKCYLAQSDTVVLKDLKRLGFVMPDRREGLSIEQCYFVLKHLSQFHALSLAIKCHNPEDFYELLNVKDGISEVFFVSENEDYYKNYYKEAALNAIAMVEDELQDCAEKERYLKKFRAFCSEDTFFQTMVELVTPKEPLAVICHGDCWTNNFLFRYVDGDIAEMCIVDFQLARYASPALDLAYVAYLCLDRLQRREHLVSLLQYYADELHRRLLQMSDEGSVFHTSLTRDVLYGMLVEEFKRCGRFGLGVALDMYPIMMCDSDEAPNLYQAKGAPGSKRGDNYTSMVYRITLKGVRRRIEPDGSSERDEPWDSSIIYKCLPESIHLRNAFKSDDLFCNEAAFYNKIWPALRSFQKVWDTVKTPFKAIPKCYLAQSHSVVLKDLKRLGFVMSDRRQGLTIDQCYFVLQQLSRFHALSLAMKFHNPEDFYELLNAKDGISEENEDYYKSYNREAALNAIAMVEAELKDCAEKERYLEKFRAFCNEDTFFQIMMDLVTPKEPLAVICHGDCWTNNLLFRFDDGDIAEMCIVDFQLTRYASPAIDLAYVVYQCLDRLQRREHLVSLLQYYADELHRRLLQMSDEGSVFHTSLTRDVLYGILVEEFKRCGRFGLGVALDMYPIMMCDNDEAPNLFQPKESESPAYECMKPVWTSSETCRRKMTDLVIELVDGGLL